MENIQIGNRKFKWNGITWAAQVELDNIWRNIFLTWQNDKSGRMDYEADELYKVMRLVYLPTDNGELLTFKEFLQIPVSDGDECKKKLTESVNLSERFSKSLDIAKTFTSTTEQKVETGSR